MKHAVLYLRVSTVEQTTANQERELRATATQFVIGAIQETRIFTGSVPRPLQQQTTSRW